NQVTSLAVDVGRGLITEQIHMFHYVGKRNGYSGHGNLQTKTFSNRNFVNLLPTEFLMPNNKACAPVGGCFSVCMLFAGDAVRKARLRSTGNVGEVLIPIHAVPHRLQVYDWLS